MEYCGLEISIDNVMLLAQTYYQADDRDPSTLALSSFHSHPLHSPLYFVDIKGKRPLMENITLIP